MQSQVSFFGKVFVAHEFLFDLGYEAGSIRKEVNIEGGAIFALAHVSVQKQTLANKSNEESVSSERDNSKSLLYQRDTLIWNEKGTCTDIQS